MSTVELTIAERERRGIPIAELAEAQQAAGKILRFGYRSAHPDRPEISNQRLLEDELAHALAAIVMMNAGGDISSGRIAKLAPAHLTRLCRWLRSQSLALRDELERLAGEPLNFHGALEKE